MRAEELDVDDPMVVGHVMEHAYVLPSGAMWLYTRYSDDDADLRQRIVAEFGQPYAAGSSEEYGWRIFRREQEPESIDGPAAAEEAGYCCEFACPCGCGCVAHGGYPVEACDCDRCQQRRARS